MGHRWCALAARSVLDELQQPRMFFRVHRHHLEQQAVQSRVDALFTLCQVAHHPRPAVLFLNKTTRDRHEIAGYRLLGEQHRWAGPMASGSSLARRAMMA